MRAGIRRSDWKGPRGQGLGAGGEGEGNGRVAPTIRARTEVQDECTEERGKMELERQQVGLGTTQGMAATNLLENKQPEQGPMSHEIGDINGRDSPSMQLPMNQMPVMVSTKELMILDDPGIGLNRGAKVKDTDRSASQHPKVLESHIRPPLQDCTNDNSLQHEENRSGGCVAGKGQWKRRARMKGSDLEENSRTVNSIVEEGKRKCRDLMPGVQSNTQLVASSWKKCKSYITKVVTTQDVVEETSHNWSQSHQ